MDAYQEFQFRAETISLLELADEAAAGSGTPQPAMAVLNKMLDRTGVSDALTALSSADIFDSLTSSRPNSLSEQLKQLFDVVALPHARLEQGLREADVMVRRGDGGAGHIAVVSNPQLKTLQALLAEGLIPESFSAGNYVEVIETGVRPHTSS